jgi:hypothetical protein
MPSARTCCRDATGVGDGDVAALVGHLDGERDLEGGLVEAGEGLARREGLELREHVPVVGDLDAVEALQVFAEAGRKRDLDAGPTGGDRGVDVEAGEALDGIDDRQARRLRLARRRRRRCRR